MTTTRAALSIANQNPVSTYGASQSPVGVGIAITQAQGYTITSASTTSAQQGQVSTVPGLTIPVLTVDEAVALALKGNRHVRSTALGVDAAQQETAALRTSRWPQFQTYLLRETLRPISFTIPEGGTGSNSEERSSENA